MSATNPPTSLTTSPPSRDLTADQALEAAKRFALHGDNVWRQGGGLAIAAATAAAHLSIAFGQIADLEWQRELKDGRR